MNAIALIFWSVAAVLLAVAVDETVLALVALLILGIYTFLLVYDLLQLNRFVAGGKGSRDLRALASTEVGSRLAHTIGDLLGDLEALRWEVEQLRNCEGGMKRRELFSSLSAMTDLKDESELCERVADIAITRLRAAAGALILWPRSDAGAPHLILRGVAGENFARYLAHYCGLEELEQSSAAAVIRDGLAEESNFGEFSIFGYRYTICQALDLPAESRYERGYLWLGYRADRPPFASEAEWVDALCSKMAEELRLLISVRRLYERVVVAEAATKDRSDYIAQISHDMRTPLHNIQSILSLFSIDGPGKDNSDLVAVAMHNCRELSEIVEDVLDFARHQAGKLTARSDLVDMRVCAAEVVETFSVAARLKGLELQLLSAPAAIHVLVDRRQVKRVLANLVSNAVKYTRAGRITVAVEAGSNDLCRIKVQDTGVGLDARQIDDVFLPFHRAANADGDGVGLGLALTKVLTELNGGKISVSSLRGRGSTFTIILPSCGKQGFDNPLPVGKISDADKIQSGGGNARVLVVDDDRDCAESLAEGLRRGGFEVFVTTSLTEAIGIVSYGAVDAVISDAFLQDGNVDQLLHVVSKLEVGPALAILTGCCSDTERTRYLKLGAWEVFEKPIALIDLTEWLAALDTQVKECLRAKVA